MGVCIHATFLTATINALSDSATAHDDSSVIDLSGQTLTSTEGILGNSHTIRARGDANIGVTRSLLRADVYLGIASDIGFITAAIDRFFDDSTSNGLCLIDHNWCRTVLFENRLIILILLLNLC